MEGPTARKYTRKNKRQRLIEGEDGALETMTVERTHIDTPAGPIEKKTIIPIRLEAPRPSHADTDSTEHIVQTAIDGAASGEYADWSSAHDMAAIDDTPISGSLPTKQPRNQTYYMQEFANRVDHLLEALLSREALPEGTCRRCNNRLGSWRCKECFLSQPSCRSCMRQTHMDQPFHRIERWTGTHFQPADLWQVGVYIRLRHTDSSPSCQYLQWQETVLEDFQRARDDEDESNARVPKQTSLWQATDMNRQTDLPDDATADSEFMDHMDRLYHNGNDSSGPDVMLEEDDDHGCDDPEADVRNEELGIPESASAAFTWPHVAAPATDGLNNSYVRIIHTNGVHHLALATCSCSGEGGLPGDLIHVGLMPTSFKRVRTLFTFAVLDQFRYSNLEMKASAYQFFQMLRRITLPMAPTSVVNFYHELRRLSRLWRWMKRLKWAGFGHKKADPMNVTPGELSIFCPACPQPGINLPDNWSTDPNRWVYKRFFVADGNFKADHVRQKSAAPDLWLSEGGGMMTRRSEYAEFLKIATERLTKAPCENTFRAIEQAMLFSKSCDITGIVAIACARHGCFAPNSVVDLTRGEQQKNVDWALLEAIRATSVHPSQGIMLMYDIACQYFIHLKDRIGTRLPVGLEVDRAIGMFHVHAHKEACFFRYAASFIPGTGVCAGEILESLWSNLNTITPSTRTATLAHRAEMIDDHTADSNHKKTLAMVDTLINRFQESQSMAQETAKYYHDLTITISDTDIADWSAAIKNAEEQRLVDPAVMDILGARRSISTDEDSIIDHHLSTVGEDWCRLALSVEERQIDIQDRVRRLGKQPREDDRQEVERLREILLAELHQVSTLASRALASISRPANMPPDYDDDGIFDNLDDDTAISDLPTAVADLPNAAAQLPTASYAASPPEKQVVLMPSNSHPDHPLRSVEISLRKQQADRYLNALRESIADKSFHYSHVMRDAPKKSVRTRARATIAKLNDRISLYSRIYTKCRLAMVSLGADQRLLNRFQTLRRDDVKASTAILDPNRPGSSSSHRLSWIWQTTVSEIHQSPDSVREFQRVHWMRARGQKNRWDEEYTLVGYEMEWVVRYFLHLANVWKVRQESISVTVGASAYAARQHARWQDIAAAADRHFRLTNPNLSHIIM